MTTWPARHRWSVGVWPAALVTLVAALFAICASTAGAATSRVPPALGVWAVPSATYPQEVYRVGATSPLNAADPHVTVTENGTAVQGATVTPIGGSSGQKTGVVLLIDRSWSMNGAPDQSAIEAARAFVAERNPSEPVAVIYFAQTPIIAAPLTTNSSTLDNALASVPKRQSGTLIMDAAARAIGMLHAGGVTDGTIMILSDGQDTGSKVSESQLANLAQLDNVHIYTFGMQDPSFDGSTLQSLASESGGTYVPTSPTAVVAAYRQLGAQQANQYTLSYNTKLPRGSTVTVAVGAPGYPAALTQYSTTSSTPVPANQSFLHSTTAAILISLIVAVLIGVAAFLITRRHNEVSARVGEFVLPVTGGTGHTRERSLVELALGDSQSRAGHRSPRVRAFATELDVAGIAIAPVNYVIISLILMLVVGWFVVTAFGSLLAAPAALIVPLGAYWLAHYLADRQRRLFDSQLPDNLSVVASAMRAGQTFLGALQAVVDTAPDPSKRELRRAVTDAQLGVPIDEALGSLGERLKSADFQHVALIATLQRETGGNTAEVVELVAETIRERLELRQMVRALTAQGRLASFILSGLPIALLLLVSVINPGYEHPLFHTTIGIIALVAAGVLTVMGSFVLKKIVTIEI